MKRLVLDNMIINYLVEPPGPPMPDYSGAADFLKAKVSAGVIEILGGSIPLMEEIVGAYHHSQQKVKAMWRLYGQVTQSGVLKPGNNRAEEELDKGRALTRSESLLCEGARAYLDSQAADEKWLERMADEVHAFKQWFQSWWQGVCEDLPQRLAEHIKTAESRTRALHGFFENLPGHIQSSFETQWRRRHGESDCPPEVRKLPSFYALHLFMYTKILRFLEQGVKFRAGDGHDLLHFVDAWMADYLVTKDDGIIAAYHRIGQIEVMPFRILRSADFIALLRQ